jgi:hypothetical protein
MKAPSSMTVILWLAWTLYGALQLSGASLPLTWRWSNPAPHGNNIVDMLYADGLVIQVGEHGQIYTSEDLDLWIPRRSGTSQPLRGVALLGSRVVISGANGTMLYADRLNDFRLVNLGTPDWLEGVATSTQLAVAAGDNGAIYTSLNGIEWARQPVPFNAWLRSVAQNDGVFAVAGEDGFIATSSNGTNWTQRTSGTTRHLNRVIWMNDRFIAVGNSGVTLQSTDQGSTWQPLLPSTGAAGSLFSGAASAGARLVVGDHEFRLCTNQVTGWSNEFLSSAPHRPPSWTYYSTVWANGLFLAAGRSGMLVEGYDPDGAGYAWFENGSSVRNWLWDVRRFSDVYVAVGDHGTILTSVNGFRWHLELLSPAPGSTVNLDNLIFLGVGGTSNGLAAVGNQGSVFYSPNVDTNVAGVIWHEILPRPTTNDLQGVTALGNILVATGGRGTILVSIDGTNWSARVSGTTHFLSSVETFPGGLVATGDRGTILTSPDGLVWTQRNSGTTNWLYRVRHLNGFLVAVGQGGTILTSSNGSKWTARPSGTSHWLNGIDYVDGLYLAVGVQGTVLTSTNATDWSDAGTITTKSLYGTASHDGQFITVGLEGTILRSQVTPRTTPVEIQFYTRDNFDDWSENVFLFSGYPDQQFSLEHTTDLDQWQTGAFFEFLSGSSTLLYLEPGSELPYEFYRSKLER